MKKTVLGLLPGCWRIFILSSLVFLASCETLAPISSGSYISHRLQDQSLIIRTEFGEIKYSALPGEAFEVHFLHSGAKQLPSFAKDEALKPVKPTIDVNESTISITNGELSAIIDKSDLSTSFYRNSKLLVKQKGYFFTDSKRGFNFQLDDVEKIIGGGERVLGMDRRGHRMPLYNRAHYNYSTESNQMYFSMPAVMSSKKYALLFDNSASGFLDIAKTEKNTLSFEAVGGRTAYIVFAGESYPELINHYVDVTGKQPLPPRWAFGNYASRFGYKSEQQVRETVNQFLADDIPLDAVILDLYWFGPDIKGHVGNLDWDKNTFPTPQAMINDLKDKGVKTILITEPFILSSSSRWQDAVDSKVLVKNKQGEAQRFDFYFGNTGLIDVFDENAQTWFWDIYQDLFNQGVAGTWGDLGEPEVHPDDGLHYLSTTQQVARGDEVHNAYGHQWAKMIYQKQLELQPDTRPFIMMRSGFAGSQRFGMIPWTGDVSRSWGGLKPQVELSLQMGLLGMAYIHSDLGGFAGGDIFDKEMYIRWLQYGVFQPVYRPHAQDNIAPEPIFHDPETKDIVREFIKLRYRLLPYIYTLAYQNSTTGIPLMRPLFFEDEHDSRLFDIKDTYLWGDNFLVSPIVNPGENKHAVTLPQGIWFDFWDDTRYDGGQKVNVPVTLQTLPVMVRAGAFIPMVEAVSTIRDYSSNDLTLHYYADRTISESNGMMYEDDGKSPGTIEKRNFELLHFSSKQEEEKLLLGLSRSGNGYAEMTQDRTMTIIIHNWQTKPTQVSFGEQELIEKNSGEGLSPESQGYFYDAKNKKLTAIVNWQHNAVALTIK